MSKIGFPVEMVRRLMEHPGVVGIKDSSGDLDYYRQLCSLKAERSDWSVLIGPEAHLIESVRMGGDGGVSGGANVLPKLFVEAFHHALVGDSEVCSRYQESIVSFGRIYSLGEGSSRYISTTKCALHCMDICEAYTAEPFLPLRGESLARMVQLLGEITSAPIQALA